MNADPLLTSISSVVLCSWYVEEFTSSWLEELTAIFWIFCCHLLLLLSFNHFSSSPPFWPLFSSEAALFPSWRKWAYISHVASCTNDLPITEAAAILVAESRCTDEQLIPQVTWHDFLLRGRWRHYRSSRLCSCNHWTALLSAMRLEAAGFTRTAFPRIDDFGTCSRFGCLAVPTAELPVNRRRM